MHSKLVCGPKNEQIGRQRTSVPYAFAEGLRTTYRTRMQVADLGVRITPPEAPVENSDCAQRPMDLLQRDICTRGARTPSSSALFTLRSKSRGGDWLLRNMSVLARDLRDTHRLVHEYGLMGGNRHLARRRHSRHARSWQGSRWTRDARGLRSTVFRAIGSPPTNACLASIVNRYVCARVDRRRLCRVQRE